jgi:Ca2+-binding EF-hand superfamily protein
MSIATTKHTKGTKIGSVSLSYLLCVSRFLLLSPLAHSQEKPKHKDQADVYDLLYMGKTRPYYIRLHVFINDKPYGELWKQYIEALFADLDVSRNGFIGKKEAMRIPSHGGLKQLLSTNNLFAPFTAAAEFADLNAQQNGRISRDDLEQYYLRGDVTLTRVVPGFNADPFAEVLSRSIFHHLDKNGDGRLTKEEVDQAEALMDQLDLNEDELLTIAEVAPEIAITTARPPMVNVDQNEVARKFIISSSLQPVSYLAHTLLHYYDRDKDFHLTLQESGLDAEAFAKLDRDGNGKLDVPELADWFKNGLPDLELKISFHRTGAAGWAELQSVRKQSARVSELPNGVIKARLGEITLEIGGGNNSVYSPLTSNLLDNYRQSIRQIFQQLAKGKDYIEQADLLGTNVPYMAMALQMGDRNGDGKLTVAELDAYLNLQFQAMETGLGFTVFSQTRNWFTALDTNGDGRLSRMELRNAWKSLTTNLGITGDSIEGIGGPTEIRLIPHRGQLAHLNYQAPNQPPRPVAAPARGPLWFRMMDRNGDGYVSRREFLGSKEEFDRIDTNHDGLISPEEAEAATKK